MAGITSLERLKEALRYNKLARYRPYGHPDTLCPDGSLWQARSSSGEWGKWSNKPWQTDFHAKGATEQERMLCCANRVGKSHTGGAETAIHATGHYPPDWVGRKFFEPVSIWCGSPTNETSKGIIQKELLGGTGPLELGTGWIPKDDISGKPTKRQCGVSDVVDQIKVRHHTDGVFDGYSTIVLKSFEQGWRKFQGTAQHVIWLDEEPDDWSIYSECLTRLLTTKGLMLVTFTPLLGQTEVVTHFQGEDRPGIYMGMATWDDAPHLDEEDRARMAASYPEHERQARMFGVPMMGEGRIFSEPEDNVIVDPFPIPSHYARLGGVDFGIYHPAADAWIAWDRDRDVIYLFDCNKMEGRDALYHAASMKKKAGRTPVAWPHDGVNRGKADGEPLHRIYRDNGVNMLAHSASYKNDKKGAQPVWPIIEEVRQREATDRIKYFSTCGQLLQERRNYHQKDGKPVDKNDDCLKAMFYAVMSVRYAASPLLYQRQAGADSPMLVA